MLTEKQVKEMLDDFIIERDSNYEEYQRCQKLYEEGKLSKGMTNTWRKIYLNTSEKVELLQYVLEIK